MPSIWTIPVSFFLENESFPLTADVTWCCSYFTSRNLKSLVLACYTIFLCFGPSNCGSLSLCDFLQAYIHSGQQSRIALQNWWIRSYWRAEVDFGRHISWLMHFLVVIPSWHHWALESCLSFGVIFMIVALDQFGAW